MPSNPKDLSEKVIVYFDGVCGLCNRFVDFLIEKDRGDHFRFLPLQSETARKRLPPDKTESGELESVVVEFQGKFYFKSKAALLALANLGGMYSLIKVANFVPQSFSDVVYDFVARNRYAWFGRQETCRLPTPEEKHKFLN